jgi:hypothetical protein
LAISGEPVTRPPIPSVSRRKFSSSGDSPITIGVIFAAACAQEEGSVTEHPAAPCAGCPGCNESVFTVGICADELEIEIKKQRSNDATKKPRFRMGGFLGKSKSNA